MSIALGIFHRLGTIDRQPPQTIIDTILPDLDESRKRVLAAAAHIGYGATAGALYAVASPPATRGPVTGAVYGLLVWAAGYEGWLPWLHILPSAHRDDRGRAFTMIATHLVFGASLGRALRQPKQH